MGELGTVPTSDQLRLHLACGGILLPGWVNVDTRARAGIVQLDLPGGLDRFADGSARYVYCSHFLEHLAYPDEAQALVRHCHRLLAPGGTLRLVVPGIEKIIRAYVDRNEAFFRIQATLHPAWCTTPLEHLMYALQEDGAHRYGYDFETLAKLLRGAGFAQVRRCDFNQSPDAALRVDYRDIRDDRGGYLSLFAEAVKQPAEAGGPPGPTGSAGIGWAVWPTPSLGAAAWGYPAPPKNARVVFVARECLGRGDLDRRALCDIATNRRLAALEGAALHGGDDAVDGIARDADDGVTLGDRDRPDVAPAQVGLVGDGADQVRTGR